MGQTVPASAVDDDACSTVVCYIVVKTTIFSSKWRGSAVRWKGQRRSVGAVTTGSYHFRL